MNKDQVKGVGKQVEGEMKEQAGKLTGDTETRAKGHAKEMEGKLQKDMGDAKEAVDHSARDLEEERRKDELNRR